jgi:hypothetical protein
VLEQWPHEGSLIPKYAASVVANAISLNEFRIDSEIGSVLLIVRKARKTEERQSTIARALGRQIISVMMAAIAVDQFNPSLGELLKYESEAEPAAYDIVRQKQLLCVLAHDGHEMGQCRHPGCGNNRLKGRELCELHYSLL